jgi:peptide/nickel transport system substrate-binding protein
LIFRNPKTGTFEGSLATDWRWLDDVTLELDLRRGVRFHNGAEFVADDVVYTLEYVSDPKNAALKRNEVSWIDRIEQVDAHRVRIIAKQPFAAALAVLATPGTAIYPHEYYARVGETRSQGLVSAALYEWLWVMPAVGPRRWRVL